MRVVVEKDMESLSREAAQSVAEGILCAFSEHGEARVVFGADAGLMKVSEKLAMVSGIDWSRVALFHFNEYVRLPASHTASVRNRLRSQFVDKLPAPLRGFNEINGGARDLGRERRRLKRLIDAATVDVACVGIGINGSLAFNEPPADFETVEAYAVVRLSAECRSRLTVQGWFDSEKDAPKHAVCMTVPQIMRCRKIVCVCEGAQRAASVHNLLRGPVSNLCPASVLQIHPDCTVFLDSDCASVFWRRLGSGVRARQDEKEDG